MSEETNKPALSEITVKGIKKGLINLFIHIFPLFISSGTIRWVKGWIYIILFISSVMCFFLLFIRINPELLRERMKFIKKDTKPFDRIFFILWIPLYFITLIISGLDYRYGWSHMPFFPFISGVIIYIVAVLIILWAMSVNTHFEATVRIQTDRNHKLCTEGPYRIVRHPGYTGFIFNTLTIPLILGSFIALVPAGLIAILIIIRTVLEDNILQKELTGYKEYTQRTKYRLIPYIW